jgi:hypothetical protein
VKRVAALVATVALLAGCGGGGFIQPSNQAGRSVVERTFSFAESTTTDRQTTRTTERLDTRGGVELIYESRTKTPVK